ncbi:hypothetical protein [Halobacillus salinus]|uniref:hypothetical protein n=1 Tax=Halobacillus salinus TaxID=192814 RepID=UPI0009A877B2|nr:hypothetical protein [Halobacillus salinus]
MNEDWLAIQQQVKQDFFDSISKYELARIAQLFQLKIPGFSSRKFTQAPEPLLKKKVMEMVDTVTDLETFFKGFTGDSYDELEKADYATFLLETNLKDDISPTRKLILLAVLFPDHYMGVRERVLENIHNEVEVFHGLQEYSLEDLLKVHVEKQSEAFDTSLEAFLEGVENTVETDTGTLEGIFESAYEDVREGRVLQLLQQYDFEDDVISETARARLYQLAVTESLAIAHDQKEQQYAELKQAMDEQAAAVTKEKKEAKRKEALNEKLKEKDEEAERLKQEHEAAYQEVTEELSRLSGQLAEARETIQKLESERDDSSFSVIDEEDPFFFITTGDREAFEAFLPASKLSSYNTDLTFAEQFKSLPQSKLAIIDSNGLSSKHILKIQSFLNRKKVSYKFVSGSPERIFRSIIYYLEGDASDEQ